MRELAPFPVPDPVQQQQQLESSRGKHPRNFNKEMLDKRAELKYTQSYIIYLILPSFPARRLRWLMFCFVRDAGRCR